MWLDGRGGIMSAEMKRELSGLKSDVAGLKSDVGGLKKDVSNLTTMARNTSVALARLIRDISDMKRDMVTKDHYSMLMKRMDGFADMLQDSRWDWGKQKVRLDEHEKRISTLEAKRA